MMMDSDDELLEDFLIEAGEILEQLQEQLVDLERNASDHDLLNAIFRGFHTIKGGAGFLQIAPLVELCHVSENIFDLLRNGEQRVSPELMDVILQAADAVQTIFAQVKERETVTPPLPQLLAGLGRFALPLADESSPRHTQPGATSAATQAEVVASDSDLVAEAAFESLLSDAGQPEATAAGNAQTDGEAISDDEFEALLDELHGRGNAPGASAADIVSEAPAASVSNEISDDEFEALLDELHGKGQAPGLVTQPQQSLPVAEEQPLATEGPPAAASQSVKSESTVRVDTRRLDEIMNLVGELVLVRNRLVRLGLSQTGSEMSKAVSNLDVVTADLQMSVMKTRMQPIKKVFGRFPRVVRDLARSLNKEVTLVLHGEDTDLDKNLVEALADPLVHLVRNGVDHGIEMPDEREANRKPRGGTLTLSAEQEGDHILLSIADDGKGMDPEVLREKAVEKGLFDKEAAERLSEEDCFGLIFMPGFSTALSVSDVSGRGVGMDVVKTKINQLNGSIQIHSELNRGTRIVIKVPLTLAIMPTLMVMLDRQTFALPLSSVNEIFHVDLGSANVVDGQEMLVVRGKPLPLYFLKEWLVEDTAVDRSRGEGHVVIVNVGTGRVGFVVDSLIGQEEVVIKPLSNMLQGTPGMAGATITGDGRIALILDVAGMLKKFA